MNRWRLLAGDCSSMLPDGDEFEIAVSDLAAWRKAIAEGASAPDEAPALRLVDCREEDEFAFNRIDGAELIPLSQFAEQAPAKLIDGAADTNADVAPVIVYCHHGMRSLQATHFLRQRGLEKCWSLAGGIDAWSQQVDPEVPRY